MVSIPWIFQLGLYINSPSINSGGLLFQTGVEIIYHLLQMRTGIQCIKRCSRSIDK